MAVDGGGSSKANERNARQAVAARLSHLRSERFVTSGFGSNDPVPSLAEARSMDSYNKRLYARQRPTPSVCI